LGVDDIRALTALLPVGAIDGLGGIELRLGDGQFDADNDYPKPDPISGRRGIELLPGMWWQLVLGTCFRKGVIHIYSVVADTDAIPFPHEERQLARLVAANTLLHEVAHHVDRTRRIARGRWRMDDTWKSETFAESKAVEWVSDIAAPFLEERFADDQAKLTSWLDRRCQSDISLAQIGREIDVQLGGYFNATVQSFVDAGTGEDDVAIAIEFANELHYNEHYAEARSVLGRILIVDAENIDALALEAEVARHERRDDDARRMALKALARDPDHVGALRVLLDMHFRMRQWSAVVDTALKLQAASSQWVAVSARARLARAYLELGAAELFDEQVRALEGAAYRAGKRDAAVLRGLHALREGDPARALQIVGPPSGAQRPLTRLIRWEAARRAGRPEDAGVLSEFDLEIFRSSEPEWIERLEKEFGALPTISRGTLRQVRRNQATLRRL
jgi:tetratricopeptide (TPR) repeat protein